MNVEAEAGITGQVPTVRVGPPVNPEQRKYESMWMFDRYRECAPGEGAAMTFMQQAKPPPHSEVLDFGCGTGRGAMMLALLGKLKVTMVDFADNCLDPEVREALDTQRDYLKFKHADLTVPLPYSAQYGYCTDVMEHIPPQDVERVLMNILGSAQHCFFQIATVPDVLGKLIGEPLHLTIQPYEWWLAKLQSLGALVHWSMDNGPEALFYCSAWTTAEELVKKGSINVGEDQAHANVMHNIANGWHTVRPHGRQDREIMLLCGGPSLERYVDEIRWNRVGGMYAVCLNGAFNWCLANDISPSALILLDARESTAEFISRDVATCLYMVASQCSPKVFEKCPQGRTHMWHAALRPEAEAEVMRREGQFFPIPGGSTVALRAIPLLRMLGFWKMKIYGMDSCWVEDQHHAYSQQLNDRDIGIPLAVGGRAFTCAPWMVSQAQEFMDLVKFLGDEVNLEVKGSGLIAHIIAHAAGLQEIQDALQAAENEPS